MSDTVARGPGPLWLRWVLVATALLYFIGLLKKPPDRSVLRPVRFFVEAAGLFPDADRYATELRLYGWSCTLRRWQRMDPRPYFPIEADNKESRFFRVALQFDKSSSANHAKVMAALDDYLRERHDDADGVRGRIGGIKITRLSLDLPPPGDEIERYVYRPLARIKRARAKDLFVTDDALLAERCR